MAKSVERTEGVELLSSDSFTLRVPFQLGQRSDYLRVHVACPSPVWLSAEVEHSSGVAAKTTEVVAFEPPSSTEAVGLVQVLPRAIIARDAHRVILDPYEIQSVCVTFTQVAEDGSALDDGERTVFVVYAFDTEEETWYVDHTSPVPEVPEPEDILTPATKAVVDEVADGSGS